MTARRGVRPLSPRQRGVPRATPDVDRPRTRGECADGDRPCPWVACKYNLYLDVDPRSGSIKLNFPHLEPWELTDTCALDVAETGDHAYEYVGGLLNVTRERVRQVEFIALRRLRKSGNVNALGVTP